MRCRQCGYATSTVTKTLADAKVIRRRRLCPCGWTWTTKEVEETGTGAFTDSNVCGQKALVTREGQGDISSPSGSESSSLVKASDPERAHSETRAKPVYSAEFEVAWKAYGRHEEKIKAYAAWKAAAASVGGEASLRDLILAALSWQGPLWATDGWRFAKYFERYLRARKWEDEPPPRATASGTPFVKQARSAGNVDVLSKWLDKDKGAT